MKLVICNEPVSMPAPSLFGFLLEVCRIEDEADILAQRIQQSYKCRRQGIRRSNIGDGHPHRGMSKSLLCGSYIQNSRNAHRAVIRPVSFALDSLRR